MKEQVVRTVVIDKDSAPRYQAAGDEVIDILALKYRFNPGELMYVLVTLLQAMEDLIQKNTKKEVVN